MRKLIQQGNAGGVEFPIGKGLTIGRAAGNTVKLVGQRVEDQHAKVVVMGNRTFVEDLDTPYGVQVNGKKIARWALNPGDLIEIGATQLLYVEDDKPEPLPAQEVSKPKVPVASKDRPSGAKVLPAVKTAATPSVASAQGNPPRVAVSAKASTSGLRVATESAAPKVSSAALRVVPPASADRIADSKPTLSAVRADPKSSGMRIKLDANVLAGAGASQPAVESSGKLKAVESRSMPTSGIRKAVDGRGATQSSQTLKAVAGRASVSGTNKAVESRAVVRAAEARSLSLLPNLSRTGYLSAAVACVLVGVLSAAVLAYPSFAAWRAKSAQQTESERAGTEARERLRQATPKAPEDMLFITDSIKKAKTWQDITALLGEPDVEVQEKILLYKADSGCYEDTADIFRGYFVKDERYPSPGEGRIAPLYLFAIDSEGRVEFKPGRMLAREKNIPAVDLRSQEDASTKMPAVE